MEVQTQSSATHKEMNQQLKPRQQWFISLPCSCCTIYGIWTICLGSCSGAFHVTFWISQPSCRSMSYVCFVSKLMPALLMTPALEQISEVSTWISEGTSPVNLSHELVGECSIKSWLTFISVGLQYIFFFKGKNEQVLV